MPCIVTRIDGPAQSGKTHQALILLQAVRDSGHLGAYVLPTGNDVREARRRHPRVVCLHLSDVWAEAVSQRSLSVQALAVECHGFSATDVQEMVGHFVPLLNARPGFAQLILIGPSV